MEIKIYKPIYTNGYNIKDLYIKLRGLWLHKYGFIAGRYFYIEYKQNEVVFSLEEAHGDASELETLQKKMITKIPTKEPFVQLGSTVAKSSSKFTDIGFRHLKHAVALCEYGKIRLIPLNLENADATLVSHTIYRHKTISRIRLSGKLLSSSGFTYNKLVYIDYKRDRIILKACGESKEDYLAATKMILANKSGALTMVGQQLSDHTGKYYPFVNINEPWLENIGFTVGTPVIARYEKGIIDISVLEI